MGLLDEAIREHLELKRRSGGDPTEIAREEHEALAPVFGETAGSPDGAIPDVEPGPGAELDGAHHEAGEPVHPGDFSSVGQETAELDMQTVLGPEEMLTAEHPAPDEEFAWEAPPSTEQTPEPGPGQERLSFE
jgi:hypothetical protein